MNMPIQILTIQFDSNKEIFLDEDLARFLVNKQVSSMYPQFFQYRGRPYWTVFVEYEIILPDQADDKQDGMDEAQKLLYQRLREWRKEKAEKEGIPVYIIATNSQLSEVVRLSPMSLEALRRIRGFGKKKLEHHGREIIRIIQDFFEKNR